MGIILSNFEVAFPEKDCVSESGIAIQTIMDEILDGDKEKIISKELVERFKKASGSTALWMEELSVSSEDIAIRREMVTLKKETLQLKKLQGEIGETSKQIQDKQKV